MFREIEPAPRVPSSSDEEPPAGRAVGGPAGGTRSLERSGKTAGRTTPGPSNVLHLPRRRQARKPPIRCVRLLPSSTRLVPEAVDRGVHQRGRRRNHLLPGRVQRVQGPPRHGRNRQGLEEQQPRATRQEMPSSPAKAAQPYHGPRRHESHMGRRNPETRSSNEPYRINASTNDEGGRTAPQPPHRLPQRGAPSPGHKTKASVDSWQQRARAYAQYAIGRAT